MAWKAWCSQIWICHSKWVFVTVDILFYIPSYQWSPPCLSKGSRSRKRIIATLHGASLLMRWTQVIFLACWLSICKQFPGAVTSPFSGNRYGFVCPRKIMRSIYQEKKNNRPYTFQLICFHLCLPMCIQ